MSHTYLHDNIIYVPIAACPINYDNNNNNRRLGTRQNNELDLSIVYIT